MWIVHSLNVHSDLKADDLRRQLIEHAEDPARLMRALEEKDKRTQSALLTREVMKRLASEGVIGSPRTGKIGTFESIWLVEGNGKRLAIECDGDRYTTRLRSFQKTWTGSPCWNAWVGSSRAFASSEFLRNPARAMKPVLEKLQMLEIPPTAASADAEPARQTAHDAVDRVIRSRGRSFVGVGRKPVEPALVRLPVSRRLLPSSDGGQKSLRHLPRMRRPVAPRRV